MHKLVIPELVHRILNQLDESDQQTPRMWPVDNQALHQHTGNLLLEERIRRISLHPSVVHNPSIPYLNRLRICLNKQVQQHTAEIIRETVRVSQLVRDGVQEQVPSLVLQIHRQVLENVHVRTVHNGVHVGSQVLGSGR